MSTQMWPLVLMWCFGGFWRFWRVSGGYGVGFCRSDSGMIYPTTSKLITNWSRTRFMWRLQWLPQADNKDKTRQIIELPLRSNCGQWKKSPKITIEEDITLKLQFQYWCYEITCRLPNNRRQPLQFYDRNSRMSWFQQFSNELLTKYWYLQRT